MPHLESCSLKHVAMSDMPFVESAGEFSESAGEFFHYFNDAEFRRCSPPCRMSDMNSLFLKKLDALREYCGFPLKLNSAFRTSEYDKSKGRSGNGYHTKGLAVDVMCVESAKRLKICAAASFLGLSVGVAGTFIHIDMRPDTPIMFTYY